MPAWQALLGAVTAWLVVVALASSGGYGAVLAWSRWGRRVPLPRRVLKAVEAALGPLPASAAQDAAPPPVPDPAIAQLPAAALAEASAPVAPAPTLPDPAPAVPAPADPPAALVVSPPHDAATPHRLPRADAVAEVATLFRIAYEEAVALVDAGLWGAENLEEWTASLRGAPPPPGVSPEALERILSAPLADTLRAAEEDRARRTALRGLASLWGVGPKEAEALYAAGYRDLDAIRKTGTDRLAKVPGIGSALAFQIRAAAHGLAPAP